MEEQPKQRTNLVRTAASIAAFAHRDQKRKVEGTPYIFHPMAVAQKLVSAGVSNEITIAAALVHDVLENTDYSEEKLRRELGDEAVAAVRALTSDRTLSWREKKERYIEQIRNGDDRVKMISLADKIHNAESLLDSHKKQGEAVWGKFNAGREDKIWFENEMLKIFKESLNDPLVEEYAGLIEKIKTLK